jgi:putative transposase
MGRKRTSHADEFKARLALEAVRGIRTLSELAAAHRVHPTVIGQWKKKLVEGAPGLFARGVDGSARGEKEITAPLYEEIGRLKMELDWLKKKL